jgi:hypothetical protein
MVFLDIEDLLKLNEKIPQSPIPKAASFCAIRVRENPTVLEGKQIRLLKERAHYP